MPKRIVYYGPFNNNKRDDILEKCKEYINENKGNKFYYILPNGKLLLKYKEKMIEDNRVVLDANLFTFDNIVNNLLERELYTTIGAEVRESIVEKILGELDDEGKINHYKNVSQMEGFINSVCYIIGEIKRSLITPEEFKERIPDTPFYREIALVYEEYQGFLKANKLIDVEEAFFLGLEILRKKDGYFSDLEFVIIDDFFDFRPQEIELLKEIIKYPIDVYINIPYKRETEFSTVVNTLKLLKEMGFEVEEIDKKDKNIFECIGDKLFCEEVSPLPKSDKIKMISAANKYLELKRISQAIKALYNDGVELKDMAIVLTNKNEYEKILFDVFNEEGIPCSSNEEMRLIDVPLIKEFLNIIKVKLNNFDKDCIVKRIKNSYFSVYNGRDKDKVEYLLYKLNYSEIEDLKSIVEEEMRNAEYLISESLDNEEANERYEWLRFLNTSLDKIIEQTNSIIVNGSPEELIDSLEAVIDSYELSRKILNIYNETRDYDLFHRDISALSVLYEVLEKMKLEISIIYNKISIDNFYEMFLRYLENQTIVKTIGNKNGINILTPSTVQGVKYDVIFIAGLVGGKYPILKGNNFFFKDENHEKLCDIGFDIKNYYERFDKESLLFVTAVTRCNELLYLSFSASSTSDEVNIPSMFLDEFKSVFEDGKIDEIKVSMDYLIKNDISEITTESEYINHILYKYFEGEEVTEYFQRYNSLHKGVLDEIDGKIQCEVERAREELNPYRGYIGSEEIKRDIREYHKDLNYSITYFETYGKCPYKFLMERILKLEGIERFLEDFTPLDRGNIFHMVLKYYYSNHNREIANHILGKSEFTVDNTLDEISNYIRELLIKNGVKKIDKLWELRIENMTNSIVELVKMDLDRMSKLTDKMIPVDFEVPFGFEQEFSMNVKGDNIRILGKIDRIDKLVGEEKYVLYDYKTSTYGINKIVDMLEGISFQLPVYIMAQGEDNVIGGGYITISNKEVSMEIVKESEKEILGIKRKNKYVLDEEEWNSLMECVVETMKDYIESIFEGDFSINPKACDAYCSYSNICRYKGR
ncbi:PD-(D/E)XK nuclease family protein [Anaerosalibacter sp. Marseille-P3206]|uniref:PD-(D/E)XK nuclease family protein n=1 Tax=Anaerosalibacter sp. Marseille-P3206 TaxID=1871005 RepID=UPI00098524E9|nr:PD-(D/E)XK nuclease family protein [Anaerosalibacter sp. Marseille-P3206]